MAVAVAALIEKTLAKYEVGVAMVHGSAEDFAALAVATALLLGREGCLMHITGKVLREATGLLDRTRMSVAIDGFPAAAGKALYNQIRGNAVHFSKSDYCRTDLNGCCELVGCPFLKLSVDQNTTRVAAIKRLHLSMVWCAAGHLQYG